MRVVAVLAVVAGVSCQNNGDDGGRARTGIAAAAVDADIPDFDAAHAYDLLERQVAFGPRVPGSAGHRAQLDWMREFLTARADTVITQPFEHVTNGDVMVRMTNVLARFRPTAADRVLFVAHWDTRPTADQEGDAARREQPIPGANDGASGVAVLLALADVLSRHSPPLGVDLLFVDGEDYGPGEMYLGSTHYAANPPPGARPVYAIVVDMVGDRDPVFLKEGYSREYAPAVVERVWSLAERLGYGHIFHRRDGGAISDDHVPLNRAGIPAIDIIDFEYGPGNRYWHTLQDDLPNTGPEGLEAVGEVLTHLVYRGG